LKQVHPDRRKETENDTQPPPEIKVCLTMSNFFDATPDRRRSPRTKLEEITYIGMGPENGGLVLDVSDGGLSFHSVAPVQPAETVHFLLSIKGQSRIEGAGEVVWADELRTVCGLRFTSLSSGAREYLNAWTSQSRTPVDAPESDLSPTPSAPSQLELAPPTFASQAGMEAEPLFAIPPADKVYPSESAVKSPWREPLFHWILFGILAVALTVASFRYGVHIGKSQVSSAAQSAAQSAANQGPQKEPPSPPPPSAPASSVAIDALSASNATPIVPDAAPPAASGAATSNQHAEQALVAGKSELAAALASLNGPNGERNSSKVVQQLWAAVGNGNSAAEVILAGLYLNGEGVAKNCEQGRVLLMAATKNGNAEAKVKLNELDTNGCP
jgi:hypothetical protein